MDAVGLIETWDWRAWAVLAGLLVLIGWALWRFLSALVFRLVLLPRMLIRYGWVDHGDKAGFDHDTFRQQEAQRRRKVWALLRKGMAGLREGYATGVFAGAHHSEPQLTIGVSGTYRGNEFRAEEHRRLTAATINAGDGPRRTRRFTYWSTLDVTVPAPSLPTGSLAVSGLTGAVAPTGPIGHRVDEFADLMKRRRLRVRKYRVTPDTTSVQLSGRLSRGRMMYALDTLTELTERLRKHPAPPES